MIWFLILVPFVALAGAAQLVYALLDLSRRWRRFASGLALVLLLLPAWMLVGEGKMPRRSSVLLLLPGKDQVILFEDAAIPVAKVNLGEKSEEQPLQVDWRAGAGPAPSVSIYSDWEKVSAAAVIPWQGSLYYGLSPKPVVAIVDDGSNRLSSLRPEGIDVSAAAEKLKKQGATFYRLRVQGDGMGGGRLELSVSGNGRAKTLKAMSTKIEVSLVGCPYAAMGGYSLSAKLDPSTVEPKTWKAKYEGKLTETKSLSDEKNESKEMVVGERFTDRRITRMSLYDFKEDSTSLSAGFHEVSVELSFQTNLGGAVVPLTYRASTFIEVVDRPLVVFSGPSKSDDLIRHSWIHRKLVGDPKRAPPATAGDVADRLLGETGNLSGTGNGTRAPFTSVVVVTDVTKLTPDAVKDAAELVLVEPTWDDLVTLDPVVKEYASKGGSVLVICPPPQLPASSPIAPSPPVSSSPFKWLPALADDRLVRGDPRVYLLPDTSRPASFIFTLPDDNATGATLQLKLFNKLAKRLQVYSPYDGTQPAALLELKEKQRLVLHPAVQSVLRCDSSGRWAVVPPVFMRSNETNEATNTSYFKSGKASPLGAVNDLAPSWVEARLGILRKTNQRERWYDKTPLQEAFIAPAELSTLSGSDLDLPLDDKIHYPSTCIVLAALDVPQAQKRFDLPVTVWTRSGKDSKDEKLPDFLELKRLVDGGAKVIVVPIKLEAAYFGAKGPYGDAFFKDMQVSLGLLKDLQALIDSASKPSLAVCTQPLTFGSNEADLDIVVERVVKEIADYSKVRRKLALNPVATARAVDLRSASPIPVTFAYRPLLIMAEANGIQPAAHVEFDGKKEPVLISMPYDQGVCTVVGYNPFSFDRWYDDRAHLREGSVDGWGLQRLIDPVVRMTGNIGSGSAIESMRMSDDRRHLEITCRLPMVDAAALTLDSLQIQKAAPADPIPVPAVTILGYDALSGRIKISVTAADENPLSGEYKLTTNADGTATGSSALGGRGMFIALAGQQDPAGNVCERLDRIAFQTGGGVVDLPKFNEVLRSATFDQRFLGACLLVAFTALLLSPLARGWHNPLDVLQGLFAGQSTQAQDDADIDDEAEALAALDTGGMSRGQAVAQRPAGPIVQLRQMRPGDSAAAVPPARWILFVPEISDAIGSAPLPHVYETPRLQAMSILTLFDLHLGSLVHDTGATADRLRVMKRIAMLNAMASGRRGGSHRVTSLQARENPEITEASSPDQVAARISTLRDSIGGPPAIPELLENELVILVTDPGSLIADDFLRQLARECGENLCSLTALMLIHPHQLTELGNRSSGSIPPSLFDRGDLDSGLISRFHSERTQQVGAALGIVESRTTALGCDQPTSAIAKILEDEAWMRS
jgi:hypothetical protein